jgi:hypothetical protein
MVSLAGAGDAVVGEAPEGEAPEGEALLDVGSETVEEAASDPPAPAHPVIAAMIISVAKARVLISPAYPLASGPCQ